VNTTNLSEEVRSTYARNASTLSPEDRRTLADAVTLLARIEMSDAAEALRKLAYRAERLWHWRTDDGRIVDVVPTGWPDDFEWFAEGPGQRPPQFYEVRELGKIKATDTFAVYPVEPWSAYDAASDKLRGWGWTDLGTYAKGFED